MLNVTPIPKPVARVGGYVTASNVPRTAFCVQQGVAAYTPLPKLDVTYSVVGYTFIVLKDSAIVFNKTVSGNLFDADIQETCKILTPGQVVLIANIWVIGPSGAQIKLDPLEYSII